MKNRNYNGKYTKLRWSHIIGYVDHNDVVHSRIFNVLADDYETPMHDDVFGKVLRGWRWDYDRGLDCSVRARMEEGDADRVREHLTNYYDIPFYENGYHDVQFFCEQMDKEGKDV